MSDLAFSTVNNLLLASCGLDGNIQFLDIVGNKQVKTIETKVGLTCIGFCWDGFTIAVGTVKSTILVNNLKDKQKG